MLTNENSEQVLKMSVNDEVLNSNYADVELLSNNPGRDAGEDIEEDELNDDALDEPGEENFEE